MFSKKVGTLMMDKQNKTEGVYSARYGGEHYWSLEFQDPEHLNIDCQSYNTNIIAIQSPGTLKQVP